MFVCVIAKVTFNSIRPARFLSVDSFYSKTRAAMASFTQSSQNLKLSEEEWKSKLTADEYYVLRQKGTEHAGTGEFNKTKLDGIYRCRGCSTALYTSSTKFDSGCGWPAFWAEIPGTVLRTVDRSHGMTRTEITCKACDGHLGHVFDGERFGNPINERHCVNSRSLKLDTKVPAEELERLQKLVTENLNNVNK